MKKFSQIRILTSGGVVSPGELRKILLTAHHFGAAHIQIGQRQELIFYIDEKYIKDLSVRLNNIQYAFSVNNENPNIVASIPSVGVYGSTTWVSEGAYHEIISSVSLPVSLKINITDPAQDLIPYTTGDLNFIASHHEDYWFLHVRLDDKLHLWPVLVNSVDIGKLCKCIEDILAVQEHYSFKELTDNVYAYDSWHFRVLDKQPLLSFKGLPYFDGLHVSGEKAWLGIYNRDNEYDIKMMEDVCLHAINCGIGSLFLTCNNSILIKNISKSKIDLWNHLLGMYGVHSHHSSQELNWQMPDNDNEASLLKRFMVKEIEKKGLRTEGLVFAVRTQDFYDAANIIIERKFLFDFSFLKLFRYYNIRYKRDFNPFSEEILTMAENVKKRDLVNMVSWLAEKYYQSFANEVLHEINISVNSSLDEISSETRTLYQCLDCFTIYDEMVGDAEQGIPAGITFEQVDLEYCCSLCGAKKENFVMVKESELAKNIL
jgi:rubredoxin